MFSSLETSDSRSNEHGCFFMLDLNTFREVCQLGSINCAAAYMILARGTGKTHRHTSWSAEAIQNRTSLNWKRAKAAIQKLLEAGYLEQIGSRNRPRYILNWIETREALTAPEVKAVEKLISGADLGPRDASAIKRAKAKGWLIENREKLEFAEKPIPSPVWMPNDIIDGLPDEPTSLVARLIGSRDPLSLVFLAELYALHDLPGHDGIPSDVLWRPYEKTLSYQSGIFDIWKFVAEQNSFCSGVAFPYWQQNDAARLKGTRLWDVLAALEHAGAIDWVPTLFEGDDADAQPVIPLLTDDTGNHPMNYLGTLAAFASEALRYRQDANGDRVCASDLELLVPLEQLASRMIVKAVARLRYRPKTNQTARWLDEFSERCLDFEGAFTSLCQRCAPDLLWPVADIKVG